MNWLKVKKMGNEIIMPIGGNKEAVLEFTGDGVNLVEGVYDSIQRYGNFSAAGGAFWGSVLTITGLAVYGLVKKVKAKKKETEESEEEAE